MSPTLTKVSMAPAGGAFRSVPDEGAISLDWVESAYSIHDTRPWRFKVERGWIEVWSDERCHLRLSDPDRRELTISIGAAIAVIDLTLRCEGKLPKVVLMPDAEHPQHLATIRIAGSYDRRRRDLNHLSHLDLARRLPIIPYSDIPAYILCNLQDAVLEQRADVAFTAEIDGSGFLEDRGCPAPQLGTRTGLTMSFPRLRTDVEPIPAPAFATISTSGDSVSDWLVAGRALQRLLLAAADDGLCATVLSDILAGEARNEWSAQNPSWGHIQAVVRLDYGSRDSLACRATARMASKPPKSEGRI